MSDLPPLPDGFQLEAAPQQQTDTSKLPPLPDGFQIEGGPAPAEDNRSFLGKVGDFVTDSAVNLAHGAMNAHLFTGVIPGLAKSALSAATLPADVAAGKVDLQSPEAIQRTLDLAGFAIPASPAALGRQVVEKAVPQIAKDAEQAGITLTAGQRTGNPSLLSREDAAFGGAYGPKAQEVAQAARAGQQQQVMSARDAFSEQLGGGNGLLERPADAGGIVTDAVKDIAANQKTGFQQQYKQAFSSEGAMAPEAFSGLSKRIGSNLANRAEPVIIDDVTTPIANRALSDLDNIEGLKLSTNAQPVAGDTVAGISLRGVDQARRRLRAFASAAKSNPSDARAMRGVIEEFDNNIEQAVSDGLFSGDETFIQSLKDARSAYRSYQQTFKPQGAGDDVGRVMQTIVERDATPEQVANYLYGSAKVGASPLSVRLADRIKGIVGEDSPHWAAVRQGAWDKLTGVAEGRTPYGAAKTADRISEFVNGDGKSLATRLFSPEEIAQMKRFAAISRAMATKAGTVNASQSGNRLAALARESLATIGGMLGAHMSGPAGAGAGYAAGKIVGAVGNAQAARTTRQLFSGVEPQPLSTAASKNISSAGERLALPAALSGDGRRRGAIR